MEKKENLKKGGKIKMLINQHIKHLDFHLHNMIGHS